MEKSFKFMKRVLLFISTFFLLSSCATILNRETTVVKVSADKESSIIFNKDTIKINSGKIKIYPKRSKQDLKITVLKDSLIEDFYFKRKLSNIVYLNIYNYAVGLLVDLTNDKRFTYRHNIHFATDSINNKIILSNKKITYFSKNTFFVYTSPLQALDEFSIAMPTLGAEYFIKNNFSISAEYGYTNSPFRNKKSDVTYVDEKASLYRVETKLYNKLSLTNNVHWNEYIGLEFREITSQYNNEIRYYDKNTGNELYSSNDFFATKKTVSILNLKCGIIIPLDKHFYFDFYAGLGIRTKDFQHTNLEYNRSIHQVVYNDFFDLYNYREFEDYDRKSFLNTSLGFKFGFKF
ncbi:hypothetical protein N9V96_01285 [Polaribacter sp.]|nr:hypothetical protein [Polaribacter sp.]